MPRYLALREIDLGTRKAYRGDEVPEAADWPNVATYVENGYLEVVDDEGVVRDFGRRQSELVADAAREAAERDHDIAVRTAQETAAGVDTSPTPPNVNRMTKPELLVLAASKQIPVNDDMTKAEIIDVLQANGIGRDED